MLEHKLPHSFLLLLHVSVCFSQAGSQKAEDGNWYIDILFVPFLSLSKCHSTAGLLRPHYEWGELMRRRSAVMKRQLWCERWVLLPSFYFFLQPWEHSFHTIPLSPGTVLRNLRSPALILQSRAGWDCHSEWSSDFDFVYVCSPCLTASSWKEIFQGCLGGSVGWTSIQLLILA